MPTPNYQRVIYIMTNPSFPDLVKIGYANDLNSRLRTLNNSSAVPYAFQVHAVYQVNDRLSDRQVHELIDGLDPSLRAREEVNGHIRKREFFRMTPQAAYKLLECVAKISGTLDRLQRVGNDDSDAHETDRRNRTPPRPPFSFFDCGIPAGATIQYVDDPTITATVKDERHIEYQGEIMFLTTLAKKLRGSDDSIAGPKCFMYNGEILADLRNRLENFT